MPNTVPSTALARNILRTFRVINQDRNLSRRNREQVKTLYLQCALGRVARSLLKDEQQSLTPVLDPALLNAKQLEALIGIDKKTIYGYVTQGIIPHVRIESNVRFREAEIKDWLERHTYRPKWMKQRPKSRSKLATRKS